MNLQKIPHWIYYIILFFAIGISTNLMGKNTVPGQEPPSYLVATTAVLFFVFTILIVVDFIRLFIRKTKRTKPELERLAKLPKHGPHSPGNYKKRFLDDWIVTAQVIALLVDASIIGIYILARYMPLSPKLQAVVSELYWAQLWVSAVAFYLFVRWLYIAYRKLINADIKTETSAQHVVWEYIIPLMNWFYPYKRMNEIIAKSQTGVHSDDNQRVIVGLWAAVFIATTIFGFSYSYLQLKAGITQPPAHLGISNFLLFTYRIVTIYLIVYVTKLQMSNPKLSQN